MNCLGVPVLYDPDMESVSITLDRSRWWWRLWPWRFAKFPGIVETRGIRHRKHIVVGPTFFRFSEREQQAILLHEVGHVKLNHVEKRAWRAWQLFLLPFAFSRLCVAQEFQADMFAAGCGYGHDLANALSRMNGTGSLHPSAVARIERLLSWRSKE